MKKKAIATLALAGALAVTMMPAFAAGTGSTTVGYTADASVSTDGKVMVTVPRNVTFTAADKNKAIDGFNVSALVWNPETKAWVAPTSTGISMNGAVTVTVTSTNDYAFKKNGTDGTATGKYKYTVGDATLSNTSNSVGTLNDDAAATIAGSVTLTELPDTAQTEGTVQFKDTLTFTFTGGSFGQGQ